MPKFDSGRNGKDDSRRRDGGLIVVGKRCVLWGDGSERAESLVAWDGGEVRIDKYDARCWLTKIELDNPVKDTFVEDASLELLCDEDRYFDLKQAQLLENENNLQVNVVSDLRISPIKETDNNDVDKRFKQNNNREFGAVHFSYDEIKIIEKDTVDEDVTQTENEEDIPYEHPPGLVIPDNIVLPETEKQAAKIEKTAAFIANNGTQMEILIKTKQSKNDQFQFLNFDHKLNPFYKILLEKIKNAEYIPAKRHLCHLTKKEDNKTSLKDSSIMPFPKIDISNTAYFKLINKFRSDNNLNAPPESQLVKERVDNKIAEDITITEEKSMLDPKSCTLAEEEMEKLYTSLYEQYYTYYYNYYYQLHNSTSLSQDSSDVRIEEDSKSMAINAAIYAAKAAIEKYQKEQEEKEKTEEETKAKSNKKKQHCIILRYIDHLMKHGQEFEYSMMKNGDHLTFLSADHPNHNFYQQCLKRAKKSNKVRAEVKDDLLKNESVVKTPSFPKWEDYIKMQSSTITCAPKLVTESHKSCITSSVEEEKLINVVNLISILLSAEKVGREKCIPKVVDVKATRKRKATEFIEKIKDQGESDKEERHHKSKKSSSKRHRHKHR